MPRLDDSALDEFRVGLEVQELLQLVRTAHDVDRERRRDGVVHARTQADGPLVDAAEVPAEARIRGLFVRDLTVAVFIELLDQRGCAAGGELGGKKTVEGDQDLPPVTTTDK